MIYYDKGFDSPNGDLVFQIVPSVFEDERGNFSEVLKEQPVSEDTNTIQQLASSISWVKQINRSVSKGGTVRGCHAQRGKFCQGKLVEALNAKIYDIITDARPDSKTFGVSNVYILDPVEQNKLWVPRGFLHSFAVPKNVDTAIFQYYCDNVYDKASEVKVNPLTLLPSIIKVLEQNVKDDSCKDLFDIFKDGMTVSEADSKAQSYVDWMQSVKKEYDSTMSLWYR